MIKFNFVQWENFLSNGSTPTRINLSDDKTTIITGTNGAGKTTIIDALLYGLFNKPLRNVKLGQLVNSVNKKKMLVTVNFTINGENYEVKRGQKPAVFEVYKNGDLVDQDASSRDLQSKLETDILKTNFRTFTQVVIIASMKYASFMDLGVAERRVVVEQMLDIEIISHMSTLLKDRLKEINGKQTRVEGKSQTVLNKIDSTQRLIDDVSSVGESQLAMIDDEISGYNKNIETLKGELGDMKVKRDELDAEKPVVSEDDVTMVNEKRTEVTNHVSAKSKAEAEMNTLKRDAGNEKRKIKFYEENTTCDTCKQVIADDFRKHIVDGCNANVKELGTKYKASNVIVESSTAAIAELNDEIERLQESQRLLTAWERRMNAVLNDARQINSKIQSLGGNITSAMNRKHALVDKGSQDTQGYTDEIEALQLEMEEITKLRSEVSEELELAKLCGEMLKDKGLKAKIIKQYIPVINKTINDYLDAMGAHYSFTLDEQFNETILSRYRDNFTYGSFSNGESMRINLAILFMWRKLAEAKNTVSTNLLIMDEVLDSSLDTEGVNVLNDLFATMSNSNIFVISHRHEIVDRFDNHIEVSKVGNFASYAGIENK